MNENQRKFFDEFHTLLRKYNIDDVYISLHTDIVTDSRITFSSNGNTLGFMSYTNDRFNNIDTYNQYYEVGEDNEQL